MVGEGEREGSRERRRSGLHRWPPAALQGLLPEVRQRSRPSRGRHSWPGLQVLWRQEMLLCVEQVQSLEHVLSVYQLSPTCGTWASAEPMEDWKPASD